MSCGKLSQTLLVSVLIGLLGSCAIDLPQASGEASPVLTQSGGQQLPISAIATLNQTRIELEVAATPEQQEIGLMYRSSLADNRGMLFPFNPARPVSFWMKNCLIPLDIIFIRLGRVVAIAAEAPPCAADPCPFYNSGKPVDQVIELRAGRAAELGLKPGDRVEVQYLQSK